ncbi:MAG TPA: hypothetical protein VGW10_18905 [Solirubrobacteraceae bacterium]|nr:hypothetical protein [Solirubrobacteraceae bacterium]
MARRARIALTVLAAVSVLLVAAVHGQGAWEHARDARDATTSSPALAPLFTRAVLLLRKGDVACNEPVTFYADTGRARFRMRAPRAPGPRVTLEATAPGYYASTTTEPLPVQVEGTVNAEFATPGREVTGRFCWRNRGPTPVQLIGNAEGRSLTIVETSLNGRPRPDEELELVLFERELRSLRARRGELVERAASMTGGLAPEWLLWPVVLLIFGSPLVVAGVFALSVWRERR